MKKLVLYLIVALCFVGCTFDSDGIITVKNLTDKEQSIQAYSSRNGRFLFDETIPANGEKSFTTTTHFRFEITTENAFNEKFVKFCNGNTWFIDNAKKTTYTIKSELDFDITLQNFNIVNGEKSNPCYSVFIPNNSSVNVATIDIYPEWLGSIWDLENRKVETINDYTDTNFQSVVINGDIVYYEIIKSDNTILIRYR